MHWRCKYDGRNNKLNKEAKVLPVDDASRASFKLRQHLWIRKVGNVMFIFSITASYDSHPFKTWMTIQILAIHVFDYSFSIKWLAE